jgi:type I restriction enzyme, S subunit
MTDLAEHWTTTVIRDVADVFLGKTPARNDYTSNSKYKVVKFRDLKDGSVDFENAKQGFVRTDASLLRTLKELRCGDVLITSAAHSGENIGKKCAYVPEIPSKFERVYFTGELLNVRCKDQTIGKWAYFFFRSRDGFEEIQKAVTGVHLTGGRAQHMSLPIAPLAEQRRIVAKLEKLLRRVGACQQRLAKIPVVLKRFRQSVLAAACSGRLTADWREENEVDDEWTTEPLSELFTMRNGKSLTAAKRRDGDIPVYGGNGHMGNHNAANADGQVIVIGRVGAQCGNVHFASGKVWVTDNAISLEAKRKVEPAFYAFFLRAQNLNQLSAGTGQPYVSQEILGQIETPVVSLPEQQEIVRRVEALFALADQIEARYAKAKAYVEKLTPSFLARAFRGELVPQDPNDEPASALLERLRSNRNDSIERPRTRARKAASKRAPNSFNGE